MILGDLVIVVSLYESIGRVLKGRRKVLHIVDMMNGARKLLMAFVMVLSCGLVVWLWVLGNDI